MGLLLARFFDLTFALLSRPSLTEQRRFHAISCSFPIEFVELTLALFEQLALLLGYILHIFERFLKICDIHVLSATQCAASILFDHNRSHLYFYLFFRYLVISCIDCGQRYFFGFRYTFQLHIFYRSSISVSLLKCFFFRADCCISKLQQLLGFQTLLPLLNRECSICYKFHNDYAHQQ
ncbi:hypothetical protein SDC9_180650 [bioreactor metagenome]|uniref:Uncharacterized protein n=1 Tax=bioreactor metagenome TaxID=1076179 RepID=A0A645H3V5_9ZZZZ